MYKYKSDFLMFLNERGYLHQGSDSENLDKAFLKKNSMNFSMYQI